MTTSLSKHHLYIYRPALSMFGGVLSSFKRFLLYIYWPAPLFHLYFCLISLACYVSVSYLLFWAGTLYLQLLWLTNGCGCGHWEFVMTGDRIFCCWFGILYGILWIVIDLSCFEIRVTGKMMVWVWKVMQMSSYWFIFPLIKLLNCIPLFSQGQRRKVTNLFLFCKISFHIAL